MFWSPDSKHFVALRTEKGEDRKVYLIESTPKGQLQPRLQSYDYRKPGDKVPITKPHLFDVAAKKEIPIPDELFANPYEIEDVRWSPDSSRFTFLFNQRGHQALRIISVDAATGEARAIVDETSKTFVDYSQKMFAQFFDKTERIDLDVGALGLEPPLPDRLAHGQGQERDHLGRVGRPGRRPRR